MGLLSDFFIADGSNVPNYNGGENFDELDKCQYKGLTPLEAAQFLAVLRDREYDVGFISEFQLLTPEDSEEWTMAVPQDMVAKLAMIDDANAVEIARRFSDATKDELGWSADDFLPIVTGLTGLARRAVADGKSMYLWNSL